MGINENEFAALIKSINNTNLYIFSVV